MRKALLNLGLGCVGAQSAGAGNGADDAPTSKANGGSPKRVVRRRHEGVDAESSNGTKSKRSSSIDTDTSKTEQAEIFLRDQQMLLDRAKYQSVFDERVGMDYDGGCQLEDTISDDEDDDASLAGADAAAADSSAAMSKKEEAEEELAGRLMGSGPSRTMWRNMKEVEESGLLVSLSKEGVKLQEAQFEIISTEASYYKNLVVLIDNFYNHEKLDHRSPKSIIKALDKHYLFSNIVDIFNCSATFLKAMEDEWKKSPMMDNIGQVILDNIDLLKVYKDYCRNFYYQTKTLHRLCSDPQFQSLLLELQQNPGCRFITLQSYLEMPMKRIMSLRLLMDAVLRRMPEDSPVYHTALCALGELLELAKECDQESKMMSEKEQMLKLQGQLRFFKVKKVVCLGSGRHLLKEGQLRVVNAVPNTQRFVAKMSLKKCHLQLHAFSDLLLLPTPSSLQ